jgi:hypothetical protein
MQWGVEEGCSKNTSLNGTVEDKEFLNTVIKVYH